jgi:hypothetical protein
MDGFARPAGRPAGAPPPPPPHRPQMRPPEPVPQRRPAPQPTRLQQPQAAPRGYGRDPYARDPYPEQAPEPRREQRQPKPRKQRKQRSGGGAWRVVLQFVVGLLVIAGVAAAIVALYIRYYE